MAPKREPSIKKDSSPVTQPRLGPPFPSLPAVTTAPKPVQEQKPRMLRPSDIPFDPSTLEVSVSSKVYISNDVHVGHLLNMALKHITWPMYMRVLVRNYE